MFDNELNADNLIQNISNKLLKGGYVLLTFPDIYSIIKKMREKSKIIKDK
jgi:hypothetical protein